MVVGNSHSVLVDLSSIYYNEQVGGFYITAFYDNEIGYTYRLKDLIDLIMGLVLEETEEFDEEEEAREQREYEEFVLNQG
jgi:hypothetical protein